MKNPRRKKMRSNIMKWILDFQELENLEEE